MAHRRQIIFQIFALLSILSFSKGDSADFIEQKLLDDRDDVGPYVVRYDKQLTPEEEALATEARAEIAQTIEDNLVKILTVIVAENERNVYFRQDEDDGDDVVPTPNPNVLPQVAQILGAIFSGTLNITRILDSTVGLVPNIVQNQFQYLIKLVTGENVNLTATTTVASVLDETTSATSSEGIVIEAEYESSTTPTPLDATTPAISTTTTKKKYMINRNRTRATTVKPTEIVDDELVQLEQELRAAGHLLEKDSIGKSPRIYAGLFNNILANVNMTTVAKAVPSIFKGATQAFTMLENLGVLETLPGGDVLGTQDEEKDDE